MSNKKTEIEHWEKSDKTNKDYLKNKTETQSLFKHLQHVTKKEGQGEDVLVQ